MSGRDLAAWRRTQSELAAVFAHDLRSPLSAISANLAFLAKGVGDGDPEAATVFDELAVSCDELLRMIENTEVIGELAHGEAPEADAVTADLAAVARAAVERVRPSAALSGVTLALDAPEAPVVVRAPPRRLDALVRNLVSNGATWAKRGNTARITVDRDADGSPRVTLRDPGPAFGEPAEAFARERQAHLKNARAGRYSRGLGPYVIGLAAKALGATLASSHDGQTSTLTVTLPRG